MYTRDDHVITITHPDGTTVVEHADGTRISTLVSALEVAKEEPDSKETGCYNFSHNYFIPFCVVMSKGSCML